MPKKKCKCEYPPEHRDADGAVHLVRNCPLHGKRALPLVWAGLPTYEHCVSKQVWDGIGAEYRAEQNVADEEMQPTDKVRKSTELICTMRIVVQNDPRVKRYVDAIPEIEDRISSLIAEIADDSKSYFRGVTIGIEKASAKKI